MLQKMQIIATNVKLTLMILYCSVKLINGKQTDLNYCYSEDNNQYNYFASKTSYQAIYNELEYHPPPEECKVESLWMLVRHGTCYATETSMLCEKDIENLRNWKLPDIKLVVSDHLTPEGHKEMLELARRYKKRFPEVFNHNLSSSSYKFQYTPFWKDRVSAIAFGEEIFAALSSNLQLRQEIIPFPDTSDLLLLLNPDCAQRVIYSDKRANYLQNLRVFENGEQVRETMVRVSQRLGFDKVLSYDTVTLMYNMCQYEKAWNFMAVSAWCAVFTKADIKVFEYIYDLSYYYNSGPGLEINKEFGCPLLQDMITQFKSAKENASAEHYFGKFYFGHSSALFALLAQLGTFIDKEHITAGNFNQMKNRSWRTSVIDPFGSNFASVLLSCSSGDPYRIMFYLNEKNLKFNECNGYVCNWDHFYTLYKDVINPVTCNTKYCDRIDWFSRQKIEISEEIVQIYYELIRKKIENIMYVTVEDEEVQQQ
ncbi:multiple inositol polyphosphate phosphatase 1-like [Lycorma delicatula]|uniref:multiple inositol polyphosphate phosphatase 1-like n=1 Tax=Lycorma delicatula TaxID=130591 RepID=UPI003F518FEA